VSSSYVAPRQPAHHPRLDGDRVRILQNRVPAWTHWLSNDHAVPSDPIAMERVEVLRG
jgi:iron complex outermembrane receptor protein